MRLLKTMWLANYAWQKLLTGNLSMGGNMVTDVSLPVTDNDVTNKAYLKERLDKAISSLNTYINVIMAKFEQNVYRTAFLIDGTMVPTSSISWNDHRINNLQTRAHSKTRPPKAM